MTILLDTHVLLWALFEPDKLSAPARDLLATASNVVWTSSVNFFEIAQKHRVGKLPMKTSLVGDLPRICREGGWRNLELSSRHAVKGGLHPAGHRDPFDRLLAAQALEENWNILSKDTALDLFGVQRIW